MSNPATIPCGQLALPALVARVASTMDLEGMAHPPYDRDAGFCRFCGHPLAYAFSMTRFVAGAIQREEYAGDSQAAFRMQSLDVPGWRPQFGNGIALVWARNEDRRSVPTIVIASNRACDALTDEVFRQATAIARDRGTKARLAILVKTSAKEIAAKKAAQTAARAMAGQLTQPAETQPPDDGSSPHF